MNQDLHTEEATPPIASASNKAGKASTKENNKEENKEEYKAEYKEEYMEACTEEHKEEYKEDSNKEETSLKKEKEVNSGESSVEMFELKNAAKEHNLAHVSSDQGCKQTEERNKSTEPPFPVVPWDKFKIPKNTAVDLVPKENKII